MVFLAITAAGLAQALQTARADDVIWCGADAIGDTDYLDLGDARLNRFIYELNGRVPDGALDTIREHHPSQTIWIEAAELNE